MRRPTGTPCRECPWRRVSPNGWLGGIGTPEEWGHLAHSDEPIACHLTVQEDDVTAGTTHCSGAAIYRTHICKAGVERLPASPDVFANRQEFLDHHNARIRP